MHGTAFCSGLLVPGGSQSHSPLLAHPLSSFFPRSWAPRCSDDIGAISPSNFLLTKPGSKKQIYSSIRLAFPSTDLAEGRASIF